MGHLLHTGEKRIAYTVLVGKLGGKSLFGGPRGRWEYNVKMNLKVVVGLDDVYWIDLAQDRDKWQAVVNMVLPML